MTKFDTFTVLKNLVKVGGKKDQWMNLTEKSNDSGRFS